jgi:type IV secretory pathway VirB4 component
MIGSWRVRRTARAERRARLRSFERSRSQPPELRLRRGVRLAERPGHIATTAHVQAAYPFVAEAGLGTRGVLIGRDVYGGPFVIDPWLLYVEGRLHDPNMIIVGRQDMGKSTLTKTLCFRQRLFGRRVEVTDPKGEYDRLIEALGGVVLRLEPGGRIQLNPLERIGSDEQRQALLHAVARAILARELHQCEAVGLTAALAAADARAPGHEVSIPDVVSELRDPLERTAAEMNVPARRARYELRDCALALHRLCAGPLRGMFDGPTNAGEHTWDAPAISLNICQLGGLALDDTAIAITMICATAFLDAKRRERAHLAYERGEEPERTIRSNDEGWRILTVPGLAEYYQRSFKLSRETGVQNVLVCHRFSDLSAVGDEGSRVQQVAEGVVSETATRVIYRQAERDLELTTEVLGLSDEERAIVGERLGQGEALWRIEARSFRVRHLISSIEWPLIQTDRAMGARRGTTAAR